MGLISINAGELNKKVKNPKLWAIVILSALLVGGVSWWWINREKKHRDLVIKLQTLNTALTNKWLACLNAPPDTVFHPTHIVSGPSEIIKPKPRRIFGVAPSLPDSIGPLKEVPLVSKETLADECPKGYYNDTTKVGKFSVNWEAIGCIRSFRILEVALDHNYMVVTKNHTIIQHDTVEVPALPKTLRWGLSVNVNLNSFSSFPGGGAEVFGIIQNRLTIGVGPQYFNGLYVQGKIGYIFN